MDAINFIRQLSVRGTSRKIFQCTNKSEKKKLFCHTYAVCLLHSSYTQTKIKKTFYIQTFKIQKCCCSSVQPSDFCKTMAECDNSAVISEHSPGMDSNDMMDTSWNVSSSSSKRAPNPGWQKVYEIHRFACGCHQLIWRPHRWGGGCPQHSHRSQQSANH
jgi:hypothetical protein